MLSVAEYAELQAEFGRTAPDAMALRLESLSSVYGDDARIWFLLGAARHQLGKLEAALEAFDRTLSLNPAHLQALNAKSGLLAALDRRQDALELLEYAREQFPRDPTLLVNMGYLYEQDPMRGQSALDLYDAALVLDPGNRAALMNRGCLLAALGRTVQAIENNQRLVEKHPQLAAAHFNLADALLAAGRYADAVNSASDAIDCDPSYSKAYAYRTLALAAIGDLEAASKDMHKAKQLDPSAFDHFRNWLYRDASQVFDGIDLRCVYLHLLYREIVDCNWSRWKNVPGEFVRLINGAVAAGEPLMDSTLPFISLAIPMANDIRAELARSISSALQAREKVRLEKTGLFRRRQRERIRIGYVSPDFRRHPGGQLLRRLFRLHDRTRFEVYGYALDLDDDSDVRRDIRSGCDVFRETAHLSSENLSELVGNDEIDILVDPSGYTRGTRPELFAGKFAPIQVSYLGYPGTLGAEYMDYAIVDTEVCPHGDERWWTEKLVRLPDTYFIVNNRQEVDSDALRRADMGLPEDAFVFCCFNNPYKIDPETFDVWTRILRRVPGSVLWLYVPRPAARENLWREAGVRGIDAGRIVIAAFEPRHQRHLARQRLADLFLDTRFVNAHTTGIDALWCGVPLISVAGDAMASRVGASLLKAADLRELVCRDWQDYEDKAVWIATHPLELSALKARLVASHSSCPLFDTEGRVRQLEAAYEEMWQRHLAGLPPVSFEVKRLPKLDFGNRWH